MQQEFDELAKRLAQSTTRRQALKRFGLGLAGMALACFGLANRGEAASKGNGECNPPAGCDPSVSCCCHRGKTQVPKCNPNYGYCSIVCLYAGAS
jgi:hypothetical protein